MDHATLFLSTRSPTAAAGLVFALNGPAPTSPAPLRSFLLRPRTLYLRVFEDETDAQLWATDDSPLDADGAPMHGTADGEAEHEVADVLPVPAPHARDGLLRTFVDGEAALVDLCDVESTTTFFLVLGGSTSDAGVRVIGVAREAPTSDVILIDQPHTPVHPPHATAERKRRRVPMVGDAARTDRGSCPALRAAAREGATARASPCGRSAFVQAAEQTPASMSCWTGKVGAAPSISSSRRQRHVRAGTSAGKWSPGRPRLAWSYAGAGGWRDNTEDLVVASFAPLVLPETLGGAVLKVCRLLAEQTSVFLTGPPGCGKTHFINDTVKALRAAGASVSVCGSTGVAAALVRGVTVHSWVGYTNGDADVSKPLDTVVNEVVPFSAKKRICTSTVLVIDEVGTLSSAFVTRLDLVLRVKRAVQWVGALRFYHGGGASRKGAA